MQESGDSVELLMLFHVPIHMKASVCRSVLRTPMLLAPA